MRSARHAGGRGRDAHRRRTRHGRPAGQRRLPRLADRQNGQETATRWPRPPASWRAAPRFGRAAQLGVVPVPGPPHRPADDRHRWLELRRHAGRSTPAAINVEPRLVASDDDSCRRRSRKHGRFQSSRPTTRIAVDTYHARCAVSPTSCGSPMAASTAMGQDGHRHEPEQQSLPRDARTSRSSAGPAPPSCPVPR